MTIPSVYRKDKDKVNFVFDYIDTLTGQGFINFYPMVGLDENGAEENNLTTQKLEGYKTSITEARSYTGGFFNWTKLSDENYDLEVQVGATIKGKAVIKVTLDVDIGDNETNTKVYFKGRLRKWDGTTETEISSAKTPEIDRTGDGQKLQFILLMDINNKVRFNKGETIRFTAELWGKLVDSSNVDDNLSITYYFDPYSRLSFKIDASTPDTDKGVGTDLRVTLPFEIPT